MITLAQKFYFQNIMCNYILCRYWNHIFQNHGIKIKSVLEKIHFPFQSYQSTQSKYFTQLPFIQTLSCVNYVPGTVLKTTSRLNLERQAPPADTN
jgi:hypothetical protein